MACIQIFPRRRFRPIVAPSPVVITIEVIDAFSDMPLYSAAEAIGISETALKSACRKLGVRHWPCRSRRKPTLAHCQELRDVLADIADG